MTVIEVAEKDKLSLRQLGERFCRNKIQMSNLIKKKDEINDYG